MLELLNFAEEAGGDMVKADFSDCWDSPTAAPRLYTHRSFAPIW